MEFWNPGKAYKNSVQYVRLISQVDTGLILMNQTLSAPTFHGSPKEIKS